MTTETLVSTLDIQSLNEKFSTAHPKEILDWAANTFPDGLVQTSAFNLDDMMITDLLYRSLPETDSRQNDGPPVIFLETYHHFPQTLELVEKAKKEYGLNLKTYQAPNVDSRESFAAKYGEKLWEKDVLEFHRVTKIDPLNLGLDELKAVAWITGRRRDQNDFRANMPVLELDKKGRMKINPLAFWSREKSWEYARKYQMIYNPLHDCGYASIGDEPLTTPVKEGEDERAGRWRGSSKTECGIHD
eukprot:m.306198 g.306198  ORF g.306198 m.306198 type:complete len:245 (+) comp41037_c0_seq1:165-899(+)